MSLEETTVLNNRRRVQAKTLKCVKIKIKINLCHCNKKKLDSDISDILGRDFSSFRK